MIKKLLFGQILLIIIGQFTFGQTKVYNGNFNTSNFQGNVSYNYIEQPEKRIFNGAFTFKNANNSVNISGSYLNDFKNGAWKYVLTNVANTDIIMKYVISANVTGSFKEGDLDGNWNLSRTKVISFSNSGISEYYQSTMNDLSYLFDGKTIDAKKSSTVTEKSSVNFKNNHFAGTFSYSINNGKSIVSGQFNEQGYFDGAWTVNYYQNGILHLQTRNYQNGVLLTIKNKDNSTGEVTTIYDKTVEVNEFFQNYNESENFSKKGKEFYNLIEGKTTESNVTFLEDAISIWYNNTSLSKSAYIFEIERGSNKFAVYPERKITYDKERTEKLKQEEDKINEEIQKKKDAEEYEKRQIQLAKENQEREKQKAEEEKIRKFESSDYGKIKKAIKTEFSAWLAKGEFESQSDFENRVKTNQANELQKITDKVILSSKNEKTRKNRYGLLGEYNIESETYLLPTYGEYSSKNKDIIHIKISKGLAQAFKTKFSGCYYKENQIIVVPQDYIIIDNNWVLSSALIVLNSKFQNETWFGMGKYSIAKQTNGKVVFSTRYTTPELNNYKIKDIKECSSVGDDLYVYEWSISEESFYNVNSVQSVNFTLEDLGIESPIK